MGEKYCPKCGEVISGHPAVSRRDNKTEICSDCGTREALEDVGLEGHIDEVIEKKK